MTPEACGAGRPLLVRMVLSGALCAPAVAQCELGRVSGDWGETGFGNSVSLCGNRLVTGCASCGDGDVWAVCIFERCGAEWVRAAELIADDARPGTGFGRSPSVSANRVAAGAPYDDTHTPRSGSAYVFEYADGVWSQAAKLVGDDVAEGARFGHAVAISADYVVVGAPNDDAMGYHSGSAYVFERDQDGTWSQATKLVASDGAPVDKFGNAVAISGNAIVVGAWNDDDLGWNAGSAYVFERASEGGWSETAKLLASDAGDHHRFGTSAAVSGGTAIIGAPAATGGGPYTGAAYVFDDVGDGNWLEVSKIFASDLTLGGAFASSVALDRRVGLVGAPASDHQGTSSGSAYVFVRSTDGSWSEVAKLVPDDGEAWDSFGNAVAASGNIGVIGMFPHDPNEPPKPGQAYIYAVGPDEDGDGVMDACECPGDLNHDWIVGHSDLGMFLASWQLDDGGDCDGDGDTDHADLGILLANWGNICP